MQFAPCSISNLTTFDAYLASLSSPIDSYLEDHILSSQFYKIVITGQEIGSFAIHPNTLLTHFNLTGPARRFGQQAFAQVLQQHSIKSAYVPTCDEFFLSHALDAYAELKKQAYFFAEGDAKLEPLAPELSYRLAALSDAAAMRAISGDFLDKHEARIQNGELYVGLLNDELIAIGVIERSTLLKQHASIGMFTHQAHRQQGIGAQTIRYMRSVCHAEGLAPIAGCWYYNHASKKTLEAAGMVTQTRLLRIEYA
jgi:GNAT superfamily N-acetyltransferase